MKKIITFSISLTIGLGLFILVLKKTGIDKIIKNVGRLNFIPLILVLLIFLFTFLITTYKWDLILKNKGYKIAFKKLLAIKFSGFAVSYITPIIYIGGEWVRSYILKKEADVPMVDGLSSVIIDKIIDLIMGALMLLLGAFILIAKMTSPRELYLGIIMIALPVIGLIFFYFRIKNNKKFFVALIKLFGLNKIKYINNNAEKIHQLEDKIYDFFRNHPKAFAQTLLLGVIDTFFSLIILKIILISLSFNISFLLIVLIRSMAMLVTLIPIPAAIGIYEGSFAFVFTLLNLETHIGVFSSLIIRCLNLIPVVFGLIYLSHFGIKLTKAMTLKKFNGNNNLIKDV